VEVTTVRSLSLTVFLACGGLSLACLAAGPPARADSLLDSVATRLAAVADPPPGVAWPPKVLREGEGLRLGVTLSRRPGRKPRPVVRVAPGLMDRVVRRDADVLAFLLARELAHVLLGHKLPEGRAGAITGKEQLEADRAGVELLLRAGFSYRWGARALILLEDLSPPPKGRPSAEQRLALLDRESARLWRRLPAFRDGLVLLATGRHVLAEPCFERVVAEFPGCSEGWAFLGQARLVQYCDGLTADELADYRLGHLVLGGFRRRLPSLEPPLRGKSRRLWWQAVEALHEALRQRPDDAVLRGRLGLAYLVAPDGSDFEEALPLLEKAVADAARARGVNPADRAALLVNLGVAHLARGRRGEARKQLDRAGQLLRLCPEARAVEELASALRYNEALLAGDGRARGLFEGYLKAASPLSSWWAPAYERYAGLCAGAKRRPRAEEELARRAPRSPAPEVKLASGGVVKLGEDVRGLVKQLGAPREVPILGGTNLKRLRFERHGVEVIATDVVLVICLALDGKGGALRLGQTLGEVERRLGRDRLAWAAPSAGLSYLFYERQGVGVRLRAGKVVELVLVEVPGERP
jgi:tetratricopeptide (TPR) repeat protein